VVLHKVVVVAVQEEQEIPVLLDNPEQVLVEVDLDLHSLHLLLH
jgi:hypothetical protein